MKAIALFLISLLAAGTATTADGRPPNIVIIFTDDLAYGDIEPFRAEGYATHQPTPRHGACHTANEKVTADQRALSKASA